MIQQAIFIVQIVLAALLIVVIIVQQKGTGLGSSFGGGDMGFYRTKRGAEKLLFQLTILLSILFIASSIVGLVI